MKLLVIETGSGKTDMFLMHMIGNLATHRRTYHGAFFFHSRWTRKVIAIHVLFHGKPVQEM